MNANAKTTPVEVDIDLHLNMSMREASALLTIMYHIAGKLKGPRGVAQTISNALYDEGVRPRDIGKDSASIDFPDTWARFEALKNDGV